jgi:hypothetical protein
MSCPAASWPWIGSTAGSKNIGLSRVSIASSDSPAGGVTTAPPATAALTAVAKAAGGNCMTNFCAVRLL